jgi:hypothetical protein
MTSEFETPENYIYWSGLCAISAVVGRKIWLDKFGYKLYPNIYVLLVGDSGLRKSFANSIAEKLVEPLHVTRIIGGRNSIQSIVSEMAKATTFENGGPPLLDSWAFLNSGEFINLILEDPQGISILTQLYDANYNQKWTNTLKSSGREILKNPYVTLLGASNETLLNQALPKESVTGGFVARTIFVHESKRRLLNSLMDAPARAIDYSKLSEYLRAISTLNGPFKIEDAAKKFYKEWYHEFYAKKHEDKTGYTDRMNDSVLKVAILLSLNEDLDLTVKQRHLEKALGSCIQSGKAVVRNSAAAGKSELAEKTRIVLYDLIKNDEIARIKFLQAHYGDIDSIEFDRVIDNLIQSNAIDVSRREKESYYKLKPEIKERYL